MGFDRPMGPQASVTAVAGSRAGAGAVKEIPAAISVAGAGNSSSASKTSVDTFTTTACGVRGRPSWKVAARSA